MNKRRIKEGKSKSSRLTKYESPTNTKAILWG